MRRHMKKAMAVVAAAVLPLAGGAAVAGEMAKKTDTSATNKESMGKEKASCGAQLAAQAPTLEKSAALLSTMADTYAAHAQWVGDGPQAKEERTALNKAAASYRELSKQMRTVARQMESMKNAKDGPHDTAATAKIDKIVEMEMKAAQLQSELSSDLQKNAQQMEAAAQQMKTMTGTGGSGRRGMDEEEDESLTRDAWPPMPEERPPK